MATLWAARLKWLFPKKATPVPSEMKPKISCHFGGEIGRRDTHVKMIRNCDN